ncbi:winged helix-turn-helix domain-containing protein [Paraburkholderia bannensis]|uniref:winged helix-turn-helix domain-containing protein n=1 Tax=Paraburkholderia bannensis TaxID=765414 RepID=UPI002ABE5DBF|nr:winged helix-turn-helix domain-containing protein [Paraburkholderia bannensis]
MRFGELEIERDTRQVLRDGVAVRLSSRAFDLLALLLDANGALVSTDEILARVWPTTIVEENNIQVHIAALRRLLGENRHLIQTVSGRGYRMSRPQSAVTEPAQPPLDPRPGVPPQLDLSIPHPGGFLFGRQTCIDRLIDTIREGSDSVITLTGPAGVGKSRLAQEAARYLGEQNIITVSYLSLASQSSADDAYALIERALDRISDHQSGVSTGDIDGPAALLVLDNCDRLGSAVIRALTDSAAFRQASRTVVLLTTRTPLRITAEKVFKTSPLLAIDPCETMNAGLEMFIARVRCFDPDVDTTSEFMERARHLVEQMDGLPLAIEFAAYHTSMLGIESVALLLEQNIDLCNGDVRRMCESRHASLSAALMWTWPDLGVRPHAILAGLLDAGAQADLHELRNIAERSGFNAENALEAISELAESSWLIRAYTGSSVTYRIPYTVQRFLWQQRAELALSDSPPVDRAVPDSHSLERPATRVSIGVPSSRPSGRSIARNRHATRARPANCVELRRKGS